MMPDVAYKLKKELAFIFIFQESHTAARKIEREMQFVDQQAERQTARPAGHIWSQMEAAPLILFSLRFLVYRRMHKLILIYSFFFSIAYLMMIKCANL